MSPSRFFLFCFSSVLITEVIIGTGAELKSKIMCYGGNISLKNQSMEDVPSKICTARFLTTLNTTRMRASPILKGSKTVLAMLTFCLFALCSDGVLTARMFWCESVPKISFLIKSDPAPLSNIHCTGGILCDDKPTEIETFKFIFLKRQILPRLPNIHFSDWCSGMFFSSSIFTILSVFCIFPRLIVLVPYQLCFVVKIVCHHF